MKTLKLVVVLVVITFTTSCKISQSISNISIPRLEKENFHVDSKDWTKTQFFGSIKMKVNSEGDIWEYIDGIPENIKGEQLFTYEAALRETTKSGKKIPESYEEFNKIVDSQYNGCIEEFMKNRKIKGTGWIDEAHQLSLEGFIPITTGGSFSFWCMRKEGTIDVTHFWGNTILWYGSGLSMALSVRCFK